MNFFRKSIRITSGALAVLSAAILSLTAAYSSSLPDNVSIYKGESINFQTSFSVKAANPLNLNTVSEIQSRNAGSSYEAQLKLFGLFPIKQVTVNEVEDMYVAVAGSSFGIKIFTQGVMVVGLTDVEGECNPAADAGVKIGDVILTINGERAQSNEQLADIIKQSNGKTIKLTLVREARQMSISFRALQNAHGEYKAGMWVRDSSAGIGTMSFYSPVDGSFAGLGHAISDVDTGLVLPLHTGEIVATDIKSIIKGKKGTAGELCGVFRSERLGALRQNTECGLFGTLDSYPSDAPLVKIATPSEVSSGSARLLTTLDNGGVQRYECEIERISYSGTVQNMIVKITDKRLLERTGGIVQGMSGSPIIQNDRLIGVITHVFVNDPTRGYAVFAETMYNMMKNGNS